GEGGAFACRARDPSGLPPGVRSALGRNRQGAQVRAGSVDRGGIRPVSLTPPENSQDRTRICVVGDELVAGVGDARGMGWTGRVHARTVSEDPIELYPLAVPGETSTALSGRWESECNRRFGHGDNRLVVAPGSADLLGGVSLARSRLNLANVLDDATNRQIPTFVVGPRSEERRVGRAGWGGVRACG